MVDRSSFHREGVEPALPFGRAAPAPGPLGLAGSRGAGARPAPDARVTLIEQRVVGGLVLPDVTPHVRPAPMGERKHLDEGAAGDLVVFDYLGRRSRVGLILP